MNEIYLATVRRGRRVASIGPTSHSRHVEEISSLRWNGWEGNVI
jgi:hypothetical protein